MLNMLTIDLNESNTCFRRSFYAGLRYSGILYDDCGWVKPSIALEDVQELCKKYSALKVCGVEESTFSVHSVNRPCLVIYDENGDNFKHAVFLSDCGPFDNKNADVNKLDVVCVILGWENIQPSILKNIYFIFKNVVSQYLLHLYRQILP